MEAKPLPPSKKKRADLATEHERAMSDLARAQQTELCVRAALRNAEMETRRAAEKASRALSAVELSYLEDES